LTALWRRDRKALWGLLFLVSLSLLIFSGARSAYLGFAVAAPFTVIALWGKKVIVVAAVVAVLSVPVFWATGLHQTFLDNCVFRQAPMAPATQTIPDQAAPSQPDSPQEAPFVTAPIERQPSQVNASQSAQIEPSIESLPQEQPAEESDGKLFGYIPSDFFEFTGRTAVWRQGWDLFVESPALGYGFNADRILLNTHMHNAFMHALIQTGALGTLPFVATMVLGWILLGRAMRSLSQFSTVHKSLIVQSGGILIFLTFRGISESSGAFFGIDWLLLAPILFYLQMVNKPEAGLRNQ